MRASLRNIIAWSYKPFRRYIPPETYRYGITGGLNTLFDILLYYYFYHFVLSEKDFDLGFVVLSPYIAAFLLVFPITFTSGFLLARYITFTSSELKGRIQLFRYWLSVLGAIFLNYLLLRIFVELFHIWPTPSKILTTVIVVAYSYIFQRYFTFKTGNIKRKG
ncbi:MAG: GtrA family protein [Bacteroidales bacterium]|nr:GtrA family protein [Bacteroidales bacterium]